MVGAVDAFDTQAMERPPSTGDIPPDDSEKTVEPNQQKVRFQTDETESCSKVNGLVARIEENGQLVERKAHDRSDERFDGVVKTLTHA